MADTDDTSTRSWDAAADDWVAHSDANDYRLQYLMPRMLALLGDVRGRTILDLGCGEGGYARELVRRGARVTAVDGSRRLIDIARRRATAENLDVDHVCANANAIVSASNGAFDTVMAAMSLMDVEDYDGAIQEVARVLRAGGELVMSITHPCFFAPVSGWERGPAGELLHFRVDRYFDRVAWQEKIAAHFAMPVIRRHRPLEDYMAPPIARGLVLREFVEGSVTEEELTRSRRFRKLERIPYFLFMRWGKPA